MVPVATLLGKVRGSEGFGRNRAMQKCTARFVLMEVLTDESEERAIVAWCQMPPTCAGT